MTTLPRSRPFTVDDLDTMPDDGRRYEVIDGTLVVTPAPSDGHQGVLGELFVRLHEACPSHLRVRLSLFDVTLAPDTRVQPDLLVAPKASLRERGFSSHRCWRSRSCRRARSPTTEA